MPEPGGRPRSDAHWNVRRPSLYERARWLWIGLWWVATTGMVIAGWIVRVSEHRALEEISRGAGEMAPVSAESFLLLVLVAAAMSTMTLGAIYLVITLVIGVFDMIGEEASELEDRFGVPRATAARMAIGEHLYKIIERAVMLALLGAVCSGAMWLLVRGVTGASNLIGSTVGWAKLGTLLVSGLFLAYFGSQAVVSILEARKRSVPSFHPSTAQGGGESRQSRMRRASEGTLSDVTPARYRQKYAMPLVRTLLRQSVPPRPGLDRASGDQGVVATVTGATPRSGKTFIAVNLAMSLARHRDPSRVCVVDLSGAAGGVASAMGLGPSAPRGDAGLESGQIDSERLEAAMTWHTSGVSILCPAFDREAEEYVGTMVPILERLRAMFDYVVVDVGPALSDELGLSVVENSDELLLVVEPTGPSILNTKLHQETLRLLKVPMSRMRLVLNCCTTTSRLLTPTYMEEALRTPISAVVPFDQRLHAQVEAGRMGLDAIEDPGTAQGLETVYRLVDPGMVQRGRE